mgnify:CR=1 FL=1
MSRTSAPSSTARRAAAVGMLALLSAGAAGCTALDNFLASIPVFSFLRESPAFDPYEAPRTLPPGAVPFAAPGRPLPSGLAPTEAALTAFAATVRNPAPADSASLARGRVLYDRFCFVCHGPAGKGDGPVVGPGKFPFAPNLTLPATVQRPDGYLYGIILVGRGLMPAYGDKVPDADAWHVVNYVRRLQAQAGAGAPPAAPAAAGRR